MTPGNLEFTKIASAGTSGPWHTEVAMSQWCSNVLTTRGMARQVGRMSPVVIAPRGMDDRRGLLVAGDPIVPLRLTPTTMCGCRASFERSEGVDRMDAYRRGRRVGQRRRPADPIIGRTVF